MPGSPDPFYKSRQWRKLSHRVLRERPICELCSQARSQIADHIETIFRRPDLALVRSNLWALCAHCSNRVTSMYDLAGSSGQYQPDTACDEAGNPLDRLHSWNQPDGKLLDIRSKRQLVDLIRSLPIRPFAERPPLWQPYPVARRSVRKRKR
jgi:hypothetical protein